MGWNPLEPEVYYFKPSRPYEWVLTIGKYGGLAIAIAGAVLYKYQTKLIYPANFPEGSRTDVWAPSKFGMQKYEEETLTAPDGVKLHAYTILQGADSGREEELAPKSPTILMLHANAGNMGHRLPIAKIFNRDLKANVVMISYRGYGKSEGKPTEKGIRQDAQTALDYLLSHRLLEKTTVILYGQSIGGAIAVDLASRNQDRVHAVVLENTFVSMHRLVPHVLPIVAPFMPLLTEYWDSGKAILNFKKEFPALFLSGTSDELVPPSEMQYLHTICPSESKEFVEFPEGTHNDTCLQKNYFETIALWLRRNVLKDEAGNYLQEKVKKLDADMLTEDLEEMGAEAGSRAPQDLPKLDQ